MQIQEEISQVKCNPKIETQALDSGLSLSGYIRMNKMIVQSREEELTAELGRGDWQCSGAGAVLVACTC